MLHLEWTVVSIAIRWLVATCYTMAGVAVMCIAVAEPERDRAAPFALKVDVVGAVLDAILRACSAA